MSDVQFEENTFIPEFVKQHTVKGLLGILVKNGFAKDEHQANLILIGIIVLCLTVIIGITFFISKSSPNKVPPEKIQQIMLNIPAHQ